MKIHALADFMCSKYELLNNPDSSRFTLKLNSLRFYGFMYMVMKAKGSQLLRHILQNCIAVELYCVLVFLFFILKYGIPMRNTEQDAFMSRVSLLYFSINHF